MQGLWKAEESGEEQEVLGEDSVLFGVLNVWGGEVGAHTGKRGFFEGVLSEDNLELQITGSITVLSNTVATSYIKIRSK